MKRGYESGGVLVELELGDAALNFILEKAVCSHGLFMMAPNHWDPHSKTLRRPLRLNLDDDDETSVTVHVFHPPHSPHALHLRVFGTDTLSLQQQQTLLSQVRRMLRLSEEEHKRVIEFHNMHEQAKGKGFGRVFRSPTLFEDMVKCILLCHCQWPRTLSMAQALCELQAELQHQLPKAANTETGIISSCQSNNIKLFSSETPCGKESKRKPRKCLQKLANKYAKNLGDEETEMKISTDVILERSEKTKHLSPIFMLEETGDDFLGKCNPSATSVDDSLQSTQVSENDSSSVVGNFPSPRELSRLDENFLAKRCGLGYRASRVIKLAQGVVEGRIQLRELECESGTLSLSDYDKLAEKLRVIDGFGPFTCANVLMCMGFNHVIPADSETVRHLKQVHAKCTSARTIQQDLENIYGKYAPFQFLAFWLEIWDFYEERFGKLSEMAHSSYKVITAANMRGEARKGKYQASDAIAEPNKLKLFSYWRSSCSCRVRIALNLKGLDYEYIAVNLLKGEQKSPEFLKLNPLGLVPVLIDGDTVVSDSLAILLAISGGEVSSTSVVTPGSGAEGPELPEKLGADEMLSWVQNHINHGFAVLEKLLEKFAGKYATGDEVFLADLYLAPQIDGAVRRFSVDMNEFPLLSKFNEAYNQLPAFVDAMPGKQLDTPPEARD
ncbi:hypothetical protein AAHA92_28879 [Salvia divinorum]|uniref:Glutathione transferase n=1 Tax=Salvia divinorum TaxID=28513 RepID=A0ABD1FZP7_SALDI